MEILKIALVLAGLLHFTLLAAGLSVPRVLRWHDELNRVDPLTRQVVLVHGGFIVLTIIGFGLITLLAADALLQGSLLAGVLAGFIGLFWLTRLLVQLFYFDPRPHLTTAYRRLGYRALTVVFTFFSTVYLWTAWINLQAVWR